MTAKLATSIVSQSRSIQTDLSTGSA